MADSKQTRDGPIEAAVEPSSSATIRLSPTAPDDPSRERTDRQMRLLSIWHYVIGGATALFAAFGAPLIPSGWLLMDSVDGPLPESVRLAAEMQGVEEEIGDPEIRAIFGAWLVAGGVVIVTLSLLHGAIVAYVGRSIARRRRWRLCVLFSIFDLTYLIPLPLGAVLSVFALRLLFRDSVRREFRHRGADL